MKRFLPILLLLSSLAFGQAARYDSTAQSTSSMMGRTLLIPLPSASITVCSYPATGGLPCTNKAQVCTDSTASSCSSSSPNNPFTADSLGNFGFYIKPGAYDYTVCPAVGTCQGPYHVFVPSGINTATGVTQFNNPLSLPSYWDVTETAQPANPTGSVDRLWLDSTAHTLKCITSGGVSCAAAGGGGGTPGGSSGQVQFNNTGALGGSAGLTISSGQPVFTTFFDVTESAAPSAPGAGVDRIWWDSTAHLMKCKTSAGADCSPTSGLSLPGNANFVLFDTGSGGLGSYPVVGGGSNVPLINYNNPATNDDLCVGSNGILTNCTPGIPIKAVTSAGYTVLDGDKGNLITLSNGSGQTVTLPGTVPASTEVWWIYLENIGAGTWTLSPNGHNLDGSASTLAIPTNNGIWVGSDGSNYFSVRGIAGSAGAAGAWSALTNPVAGLSLTMAHNPSTFTYDATTGAGANLFNLTDTANNTGTGALFTSITASGSAAQPILLGTTPSTAQTATALPGLQLFTQTAADSTHNYYSPSVIFQARYWNGSVDSIEKQTFTIQCANSGTNPACPFLLSRSGTSGNAGFEINEPVTIGNGTPNPNQQLKIVTASSGANGLVVSAASNSPTAPPVLVQNNSGVVQFAIDKNFQTLSGNDASGTNVAGGNGIFRSGISTGTANLSTYCIYGTVKAASGTTAQTQIKRACYNLQTTIPTNNTAVTILSLPLANGSCGAAVVRYNVRMSDGTNWQSQPGVVTVNACANSSGTITAAATPTPVLTAGAATSGTLTVTWGYISAASPVQVQVTANSSLVPTVMQITWDVENLSDANDITFTVN